MDIAAEFPPEPLLAYLFRVAVAYYNAKPWRILGHADQVRVMVNDAAPYFAFATGGSDDEAPGLRLTSAFPADDEFASAQHLIAFGTDQLSLTFVAEHAASPALRELRRVKKWPLASPAAFPTFYATSVEGLVRELTPEELQALSVATGVIAALVGSKRKQMIAREPFGDLIKVHDAHGALQVAMVQYPFDEEDLSGWRFYKFRDADRKYGNEATHHLWNAALDLPHTPRMLDRLTWSFFRDVAPRYTPDDDAEMAELEEEEAYYRFLSWALFAYRSEHGTLAQQALDMLSATQSTEGLDAYRRIATPRAGIFRVTAVQRKHGFELHDELLGDSLRVVDGTASRQLEIGFGVVGLLHPISETEWALSPGTALYPELPSMIAMEDDANVENFALSMEQHAFGANTEWIQRLPGDGVRDAYETFAAALADTGDLLPEYEDLQRDIARTNRPGEVVQRLTAHVRLWSDAELDVMLAMVMRIWNVTPREELGDKSPDEVAVSGERVRAKRSRGGGRRK